MPRRLPEEVRAKIRELLGTGLTMQQVREELQKLGFVMSIGPIAKIAMEMDAESGVIRRRGPRPGKGGRPLKSETKRKQRGVALSDAGWELVKKERRPGESINDTIERIFAERRSVAS